MQKSKISENMRKKANKSLLPTQIYSVPTKEPIDKEEGEISEKEYKND